MHTIGGRISRSGYMAVSLDPETNTAKVSLTAENEVLTGSVQLTAEQAAEKPAPKAKKRSK